ncbi:hypothetical protein VAEU17_250159 [Vibrio aestuarianus]|nr:hypothetical protein VAEU17_250159 [Vibrio aestuarianus]
MLSNTTALVVSLMRRFIENANKITLINNYPPPVHNHIT